MASLPYVQQLSKVIVAQITQTIGWHSIQTTPLELLGDILHKYLEELTRQTQRYAELYGRTEPNLDDVALAFGDLNIQISDLEEYIVNVDSVPCNLPVPKFPVSKDSNLNFLKPGSKEVVTRPVHVHEHLPPIHPQEEPANENGNSNATNSEKSASTYAPTTNHIKSDDDIHMFDIDAEHGDTINVIGDTAIVENNSADDEFGNNSATTFKKPLEVQSSNSSATGASSFVGRPTRELISCMMTTSGFISPAREGKLPDAKKPIVILEDEPPTRPIPPPIDVKMASTNDVVDKKSAGSERTDAASDTKLENPNDEQPFAASGGGNGTTDDFKPFKTIAPPVSHDSVNVSIKKKLKYGRSDADAAALKEIKKAKKLSQSKSAKLADAKNRKLSKVLNKLLIKPSKRNAMLLDSDAAMDRDGTDMANLTEEEMMAILSAKKKQKFQQSLKRKYKKEMLMKQGASKQMVAADDSILTSPQKQRKKREPKIPKRAQGNIPSSSSYAYGDSMTTAHPMRPYSSQEMLNVHPHGNDSTPIGGDRDDSMNDLSGDQQHFDKLSNEPDKRKLNIFKKISTPSSSSNQLASQSFDPNSPVVRKSSKIHSDAMPWPSSSASDQLQPSMTPVKMHDAASRYAAVHSTPLFSDPALLTSIPFATHGASGKKSKIKGMAKVPKVPKVPKIPKEKKLKKDLTQRKPRTPKTPKSSFVPPPSSPSPLPLPLPPSLPTSSATTPDIGSTRMPMPMFPNMGFLDQFSGPGLIPSNPLFQSVPFGIPGNDQMAMNPFSVLPSFDLLNFSRFKRPNYIDAVSAGSVDSIRNSVDSRHETIHPDPDTSAADKSVKPLCHVAPFVPPSLLHTDGYAAPSTNVDNAVAKQHHHEMVRGPSPVPIALSAGQRTPYDDQKTTIIIDSDDDDEPANSVNSNKSDDVKRHTKKTKDKSSTGHNKKDKRDKNGSGIKMKKKKDKKDKSKNKAALKEEKRKKKKEKDRLAAAAAAAAEADAVSSADASFSGAPNPMSIPTQVSYTDSMGRGEPSRGTVSFNDTFDSSEYGQDNTNFESNAIPKLTLKLAPSSSSPSSRPSTPDFPSSKKSSKSWKKKNKWRPLDDDSDKSQSGADDSNYQMKRESSPELARISALITRPPKQKSKDSPTGKIGSGTTDYGDHSDATHSTSNRTDFYTSPTTPTTSAIPTGPGRGRPKGSTNSNKNKNKIQKSSSLTANVGGSSFSDTISSSAMDTSTASRQTSILQTFDDQMAEENQQVWICPACGRVDDGTPMIGCDGCDAWYHWVCVGIQVPPDQDQDWYCRVCISKKQEIDKKKKRKKKDKKDH